MDFNNEIIEVAELAAHVQQPLAASNDILSNDTIYVPNYRDVTVDSAVAASNSQAYDDARVFLSRQNWITRDLLAHVEQFYPEPGDITPGSGIRNLEAFKTACSILFSEGRIYASSQQLSQVVTLFLDKWSAKSVMLGKKIACFYHKPQKNKVLSQSEKKYSVQTSKKVLVQCPFHISYSPLNFVKRMKLPLIFHHVKITTTNFTHTCELSPTYLRQAKKSSGCCISLDMPSLTTALELLRHNPNTSSTYIRTFLTKALPTWHALDSVFISNFRKRAAHYWTQHDNNPNHHISVEEAEMLTSRSTADETLDFDDPVVANNYKQLLSRVMQESSAPWKVRKFLEECQSNTPGFAYIISTDCDGKPSCITWTTPRMRRDIIRFGDVLFLDAQMRQYNTAGFPYASIVMINDENNICTGCETLYIEESTAGYTQMIRNMATMEVRWSPSNVRFVFGDLKIRPKLLLDTGMVNAQLRGDNWHLLNEVWPKRESFGHSYQSIAPFLRTMLESKTIRDWDLGYSSAKIILQTDPEKVSKLDDIYQNPSYYAGYKLCEADGSLGRQGDSHAEQNHASIVAYIGKGGTFDLAEQVEKLMERHQAKVRQRMNNDADLTIRINKFTSQFRTHQDKTNDANAHAHLSSYAYKTFFTQSFQHSRRLQKREKETGEYMVWQANIPESEIDQDKVYHLSKNNRCQCLKRKQMLIQCGHELSVFGFAFNDWDTRWMNDRTFCREVLNLYCVGFFNPTIDLEDVVEETIDQEDEVEDTIELEGVVEEYEENSTSNNRDTEEHNENGNPTENPSPINNQVVENYAGQFSQRQSEHVTFTEVQETFNEIVRFVNNDRTELANLYAFGQRVLSAYRDGLQVSLECNTSGRSNDIRQAIIRPFNDGKNRNRLKSRREISQKRARSDNCDRDEQILHEQLGEKETMANAAKKGKRLCGLCRGTGHHAFSCPTITIYGVPLQRNDQLSRQTLQHDLLLEHGFGLVPLGDETPLILSSLPKHVTAMVIHARYTFGSDIVIKASLVRNGMIDKDYDRSLFSTGPIVAWLSNSRGKPIVSCLKHSSTQPGTTVALSQPLGSLQQGETMSFFNQNNFHQPLANSQPLNFQTNGPPDFNQMSQQDYQNSQLSQRLSQLSRTFN
jgi:hypothetical protein